MPGCGELGEDDNFLLANPVRIARYEAVVSQAASPLHFSTFERNVHRIARGIAEHYFELGSREAIEQARMNGIGDRGTIRAHQQLLLPRILDRPDAFVMPYDTQAHLAVEAADPANFRGVDPDSLDPKQRVKRNVPQRGSERRTVLSHDGIDMIDGRPPSTARQVLDDKSRLPGNVASEMTGEQPSVRIVSIACFRPDQHLDSPPRIKVGRGIRRGRK